MRSTEFDMVAMALMALGVIFCCGVMLMIGYAKASRARKPDRPSQLTDGPEVPRGRVPAGRH